MKGDPHDQTPPHANTNQPNKSRPSFFFSFLPSFIPAQVDNPDALNFQPRDMVLEVSRTILHFAKDEEFHAAISESGYYREGAFWFVLRMNDVHLGGRMGGGGSHRHVPLTDRQSMN